MAGSRSWQAAAMAASLVLALAGAAPGALAQKPLNERGSAIGTPLPLGKVEAAPIAPPPYSEAEKAALAKLEETTAALGGLHDRLSKKLDGLATVMSWLFCLAGLQLVVLGVQLWVLRRVRRAAKPPAQAAGPAEPAAPPARTT